MTSMKLSGRACCVVLVGLLLVAGCSDDDAPKPEACPMGQAVNATEAYACGDGGTCIRSCQADMTLSECVCNGGSAGGGAGTFAAGDGGTGGTGGQTSTEDDSGVDPGATDGGTRPVDSGTTPPATKPKADGSQLAACTETADCTEDRVCYLAGLDVGFCTAECQTIDDCASLTGATYTCSMTSSTCRVECTGEDDDSCPEFMSCTAVIGGTFRCLYDEADLGAGDVANWQPCDADGDCVDGLVCFDAGLGGLQLPGGPQNRGFCTQPCGNDNECTVNAPTGTISPHCSGETQSTPGACGLNCAGLGSQCPDDMECVVMGPLASRCLYTAN